MSKTSTRAEAFFLTVIRWRWVVLSIALGSLVGLGSQLGKLTKNTQADAFINPDEPALIYREKVEDIFNLRDPIVIAVMNKGESGIFNPRSLELVKWLTERVEQVPNVDPDRITSLSTESDIRGTEDGMEVDDFYGEGPVDEQRADWIQAAVSDFPLLQGSLVARDGTATLIIVELLDETKAEATYDHIMALVKDAPAGANDEIHVAGEGAVAGYLANYIDQDAKRLNPLAGLIITLILIVAFLTPRAALVPNFVVAGTVVVGLGAMAVSGVSFFVITNGLIVCMIGIAVADSIHIFSEYYDTMASHPSLDHHRVIAHAVARVWRPVTLTTLTTAAGFLALYPTNDMPPLQYFGVFGALAVIAAWLLSLLVTPCLLSLLKLKPSRRIKVAHNMAPPSLLSRTLCVLGTQKPRVTLAVAVLIGAIGVVGSSKVVINEERIENFQASEPLYQADKAINASMDGSYYLDVVIETSDANGLYEPEVLNRIRNLQHFLEEQPEINGSTSIVDYIQQMHKAVNEGDNQYYSIPNDPNLTAQLFLLYTASASPTDFEDKIDPERRIALVRANLSTGSYLTSRVLIPRLESYLEQHFSEPGVSANVSGRVNVDYHWIQGIAASHFNSVMAAFIAVLVMAALLFRSLVGGVMAATPVGLAILTVYAVMGVTDIWLGVGTSMFAAIAIGLSVDFAIYTLDRLKEVLSMQSDTTVQQRIQSVFQLSGRALWYNFLAVGLGFGVLMTSQVPPLVNFGLLVAMSVGIAFISSLVLLPAIALVFKPAFLFGQKQSKWRGAALALVLIALAFGAQLASAQQSPSGDSVVQQLNARDEGDSVYREMRIELTDRRGNTRVEETAAFRRYFGDTKKTVIFYTSPVNVKGTAFLTWDYADNARDDDQWLYLPALRKVRRISASDRGDYFLGTDFTYEEIKKESKISAEDYHFTLVGEEEVDGRHTVVVEAIPASSEVASVLGYSKVLLRVDPEVWMPRLSDYWDIAGNHLKTVHTRKIVKIDGIWSVEEIEAKNHKTGHQTRILFSNTDYGAAVPPRLFEQNALKRGY